MQHTGIDIFHFATPALQAVSRLTILDAGILYGCIWAVCWVKITVCVHQTLLATPLIRRNIFNTHVAHNYVQIVIFYEHSRNLALNVFNLRFDRPVMTNSARQVALLTYGLDNCWYGKAWMLHLDFKGPFFTEDCPPEKVFIKMMKQKVPTVLA